MLYFAVSPFDMWVFTDHITIVCPHQSCFNLFSPRTFEFCSFLPKFCRSRPTTVIIACLIYFSLNCYFVCNFISRLVFVVCFNRPLSQIGLPAFRSLFVCLLFLVFVCLFVVVFICVC